MASRVHSALLLLSAVCALLFPSSGSVPIAVGDEAKLLYIVYMGERQHEDPDLVTATHHDALTSVLGSKEAGLASIVYSYRHGFSGFAAMLTASQAKAVAGVAGVVSVMPSRQSQLTTTRSWDFLRLSPDRPSALLRRSNFGEGVIIGIVDSGIWPESMSFNDDGYGPVPKRWKGICQKGEAFNASSCNRKLIGARFYSESVSKEMLKTEYLSPRDFNGHGTHVASTAAGSFVENASFHGIGAGLARGGAPRAMVAAYKVVWGGEGGFADEAAILKAVDHAIHDGVDVLSLSLSEGSWATLHAALKGITVVYSAGNDGPVPQSLANASPWVITVAANTVDRSFLTTITLGNNQTLVGQSIQHRALLEQDKFYELALGGNCDNLTGTDVAGKFLLCDMKLDQLPDGQYSNAYDNAVEAKVAGIIFAQFPTNLIDPSKPALLPNVKVDLVTYQKIFSYFYTESAPVVKVSPTRTVVGDEVLAPKVAFFSSRGPSKMFPDVLKPDVAAPGVSILAAVKDSYEFMSGTSMSAPHVTGIVALLKSAHPNWSPAAIKSALVTTASTGDSYGAPILSEGVPRKVADPFDFGGGHVDPDAAADPGLVYDADPRDYREFNCTSENLCDALKRPAYHLNLPSISIPDLVREISVRRTVTNVGSSPFATYAAYVEAPPGVEVAVEPPTIAFDPDTRVRSFLVRFRPARRVDGVFVFGSLTWSDGGHRVRIPIAVRPVLHGSYADSG